MKATGTILKALRHVSEHHPEVTQVFYGIDNRWLYCGEEFDSPIFGEEIDVGLLEDAADSVAILPSAFYLPD